MQKLNQRVLLYGLIFFASTLIFGIALGFFYSSMPEHHPQKDKQSCEAVGGEWSDEKEVCILSYKSSGEPCTDGGQCTSGICSPSTLTEEQKMNLAAGPLRNVSGICYSNDLIVGCVQQVIMGTVSKESLCLPD